MKGSNKDAWAFFNYAIARIIEKTQKLHAMYWFNLFFNLWASLGLEASWGYQTQLTSITERFSIGVLSRNATTHTKNGCVAD